jgi:hypothetical protein
MGDPEVVSVFNAGSGVRLTGHGSVGSGARRRDVGRRGSRTDAVSFCAALVTRSMTRSRGERASLPVDADRAHAARPR